MGWGKSCCCTRGVGLLLPVEAEPRRGVSSVFGGIPNTYLGISTWDGDPEVIEISVIKLGRAASRLLGESHDISVGICAHQILVRLSGRE